ncbi:MAG: hypothetical protein CVU84_08435 [Firmicutes bacterium HGW-Firmicutes-1]|jgi:hypothetical protein|nr:MAG: hypothetical protein CVU84_08435 [Firmicutes bacterium HGW-Firmicutes-1]
MNNINTQLDLLINIIYKKTLYLQDILAYTKHQSSILEKDELDLEAFHVLVEKKDGFINKAIEIDEGFQAIYVNVRGIIEAHPELYKEKLQTLKQSIVEIGDLGIAITVQESRNKNQFDNIAKMEKSKVKEYSKSKLEVTNYYSSMKKQNNSGTSHFFDSKK